MKNQPVLSFNRLYSLSSTIFLLVVLSVFATGNVLAKNNGKGKGKPGTPPDPKVLAESMVRWGGDEPTPGVLEANYRKCNLIESAVDMSSGTYTCAKNGSRVFYDFANFVTEVAHTRGDDSRCSSRGSQYYIDPDLEYSFSWSGNCSSVNGCAVKVVNRFSDVVAIGGPVTRIRLDSELESLVLEGFGRISNSATANPFDMAQSLTIDYMNITYIGTKSGKTLAVCRALPRHENYPVRFETVPVGGP